jgi:hypothetical protein
VTPVFAAFIRYQLALLECYEFQLAHNIWDEGRLNEALKSWLASQLPVLRAQRALNEQTLIAYRDFIGQYRGLLEAALRQQGGPMP